MRIQGRKIKERCMSSQRPLIWIFIPKETSVHFCIHSLLLYHTKFVWFNYGNTARKTESKWILYHLCTFFSDKRFCLWVLFCLHQNTEWKWIKKVFFLYILHTRYRRMENIKHLLSFCASFSFSFVAFKFYSELQTKRALKSRPFVIILSRNVSFNFIWLRLFSFFLYFSNCKNVLALMILWWR